MSIDVSEGHDRGAKLLLGHPRVAEDFLRAYVPAMWLGSINFDSLQPYSTERVDAGLTKRIGDIAWSASYEAGGELIVLIEAQSTCDQAMAPRMATLVSLLCEHRARRRRNEYLPNLLPIVYYTGRTPWTAPADLSELIDPRQVALPFMRKPCYLLVAAGQLVAEGSMPEFNTASLMMRMEAAADGRELMELLQSSAVWLGKMDRSLWLNYLTWANRVLAPLRFPGLKLDGLRNYLEGTDMLAETMREWFERETERTRRKGLSEGLSEGRAEGQRLGQRELLRTLASRRFGQQTAERLSEFLDEAPNPAQVRQAGEWILDCRTEAEFLRCLSSAR